MAEFTNVVIAVQARSTSKRFPGKVFQTIGGKPMIRHVLDACMSSANYINNFSYKTNLFVQVALLIPFRDVIKQEIGRGPVIIEGPEDDVLTRYHTAAEKLRANYVVRVTGDCPFIPAYLITKHINAATANELDYISNVDEEIRTSACGTDCEVMSRKMLDHLHQTCTEPYDREHVTPMARRNPPEWAKIGHVIGHINLSHVKISVDTEDDLARARAEYDRVQQALQRAESKHGKGSIFRF